MRVKLPKYLYVVLLAALLFTACAGGGNGGSAALTEEEMRFCENVQSRSDIYKESETIRLHNPNLARISVEIQTNDKYIMIGQFYAGDIHVSVWDKNGKYIGPVGLPGKGPGEYDSVGGTCFAGENTIYLFDRALNVLSKFQITDDGIEYEDRKNLDDFFDSYVDFMFFRNNRFYLVSCAGPKGTYGLTILDRDLKLVKKTRKRSRRSRSANLICAVSDKYICFTGPSKSFSELHEPYLYLYDFDGNLVKKIDVGMKNIFNVEFDRSGRVLLITTFKDIYEKGKKKEFYLFDLNGNELNHFSSHEIHAMVEWHGKNKTGFKAGSNIYILKGADEHEMIFKEYIFDLSELIEVWGV